MAQLMKRTLVFGAGVAGLAALTQTASADTKTKHLTLEEVRAENAKRIATYETEKREIDERNRVKRAQYRDAYTQYAELADHGGVEPQEPEYEPLPTLELLEEPIELPFDVNDVTPVETVVNGDTVNDAKEVVTTPEVEETGAKEETTSETKETGAKEETTEAVTSEVKETGAKEETTEVVAPEVKETGAKEETTESVTSEVKETGAKEETTSESKETGEKTSSDAVAAQLEGEKTSSDAVAAQLKQTSEETTSSSDAAAQVNKIEAEKTTETTTQSETPTETTSSADAAAQVAKLEAEKSAKTETSETTTTQSDEVKTTESAPTTTDTSEKSNENGGVQARGAVTTTEKTDGDKKTSDSLPHTGDAGGLMSLMGVALSGLGGVGLRRKRK